MDFNHLPFAQGHPWADGPISKPVSFEQMRELARKLAKGLQQVRVDFYDINGQIYFGELTFSISQAIVLFSLLNGMKGLVAGGLWKIVSLATPFVIF